VDNAEITVEDTAPVRPAAPRPAARPAPPPSRLAVLRRRVHKVKARVLPFWPILRLVGFFGAVAIVVYMGVQAARDVHPSDLELWPLAVALAGAMAWWLGLGRGWSLILDGRTAWEDISVWCRTQALRFLPGGFWAPASRVFVVHGTPLDRLATVMGENVLALAAAMTIGGVALALSGRPLWAGLAVALAVPFVAAHVLRGKIRITKTRASTAAVNYVLAFAAYAIAAVLVQLAVSGHVDPADVAGAASVAWAAGLVVVIAPSGVGVREWVYVKLLAGTLPHAQLEAAAVTMRLVMIVAECIILVIVGRPGRQAPPE
jgi:glycosyltransferase 2 family protein